MAIKINKNGDVIITIQNDGGFTALEQLEIRRQAAYDAICQRNEEFIGNDVTFGLIEFLKDTEPSYQQWKELLKNPAKN
tara:strand:+ start:64 stop:300 length:237 start_codon:yes stop_codon:yes gene_type:complete